MHDTNYTLIPLDVADEPKELSGLEMHDANSVYRVLAYGEQADFMTSVEDSTKTSASGW
jgi:hypothetical protein